MHDDDELSEKYFQYLLHLFDTGTTYDIHEFLSHSKIYFRRDYSSGSDGYALRILVDPEIFKKYHGHLREYAISMVSTAEKSVDLANKLTHDLKAGLFMAESCVISTITVVSLIKVIEKLNS